MKKRLFMKRVEVRAFKIFGRQVLLSKVDRVPARKFSSEIIHWLF